MIKRVLRGATAPAYAVNSTNQKKAKIRRNIKRTGRFNNFDLYSSDPDTPQGFSRVDTHVHLSHLSEEEERLFLTVYSGDVAKVRRFLYRHPSVNINGKNFEGYSPLTVAVKNKYEDIVKLLLSKKNVVVEDAFFHAVDGGNLQIVQNILKANPSVPKVNRFVDIIENENSSSDFCSDMTPLMLAAQRGHYDIIVLLLEDGHRIRKPHLPDCSCSEACRAKRNKETLSHSLIRFHAYRALVSPVYICLTSPDPVLTAFRLSEELKLLATTEKELNKEYIALAKEVSGFAAELLAQCRTTKETLLLLNRKDGNQRSLIHPDWKFTRVGLAIDGEHKRFIAHSNCQQVLRSAWVADWPAWERMSLGGKLLRLIPRIAFLPILTLMFWMFPKEAFLQKWQTPLNKFFNFVASYVMFLGFLLLQNLVDSYCPRRGVPDTGFEIPIVLYILGYTQKIVRTLWLYGMTWFLKHKWNIYDVIMLLLFYISFGCWLSVWYRNYFHPDKVIDQKQLFSTNDPSLIGEDIYAIAVLFAFGKLMFFFQTGDGLGSLQLSMSQMFLDISRFLAIFIIIMFAFAIGMYKLYHNFSGLVRIEETGEVIEQLDNFGTVIQAFISLYWAIYGYGDPKSEASYVITEEIVSDGNMSQVVNQHHFFTEAVGQTLFIVYHILCIILLINMLVAMMSSTFLNVQRNSDKEWKFNRTKVWMTFFQRGDSLPPPFNLLPLPKTVFFLGLWLGKWLKGDKTARFNWYICCYLHPQCNQDDREHMIPTNNDDEYQRLMRQLTQRYLVAQENLEEEEAISHEDLDHFRYEIRSLRSYVMRALSEIKSTEKKQFKLRPFNMHDGSSTDI